MKQALRLLGLIVIGVAAYVAFSLVTFSPDENKPFVFNEPNLPPELIAEDSVALSAEDSVRQKAAMEQAQKAIDTYQQALRGVPVQAKDTVSLLVDRISAWELPSYFLTVSAQQGGARNFQMLDLSMNNIVTGDATMSGLSCDQNPPFARAVIGTNSADTITCSKDRDPSTALDILFIGGPDKDSITDARGNRIVNGGTGDDTITLGAGRSLIILDPSWGHDALTVDCSGAQLLDTDVPKGFAIPWVYKTTNFIVLGKGLDAKEVAWEGNVLTHKVTGDTLTVNQNCFTVVPAAQ